MTLEDRARQVLDAAQREDRKAGRRRKVRRAEPRIISLASHPRAEVCLTVAADYLGMDERTVRARIEDGRLPARRDGKVYRISLNALAAYDVSRATA